jgi:uncharacterized Zn finger protein
MKKNSTETNLEMKCSECGKVTKHYLSSKGEYRCLICGTVNKTVTPKKKMEVTFEADEELDKALNPQEIETPETVEETVEEESVEEVLEDDSSSEI